MNNLFIVGPEVRGENQIGYQRYIDEFTKILLDTQNNISIIGLKQFGKTSVAKEVLRRVKERSTQPILTLFIDLVKQKTYSDLLVTIVDCLQEEILENDLQDILANKVYQLYIDRISKIKSKTQIYRNHINSIFKTITQLGYKIILALDEFDAACNLFEHTADYEFLRNLSSNKDIGVSLVLISRRPYWDIEQNLIEHDTDSFHDFVLTYSVKGFDEDDFAIFYRTLKEKYDIELSNAAKEKLKYYCGRFPFLVSMFAHDIVENHLRNHTYDIEDIYKHRAVEIEDYNNSISIFLKNKKQMYLNLYT